MLVVLYNLFDCNLLFVPIAPVQFQQRFKTSSQALPEYTQHISTQILKCVIWEISLVDAWNITEEFWEGTILQQWYYSVVSLQLLARAFAKICAPSSPNMLPSTLRASILSVSKFEFGSFSMAARLWHPLTVMLRLTKRFNSLNLLLMMKRESTKISTPSSSVILFSRLRVCSSGVWCKRFANAVHPLRPMFSCVKSCFLVGNAYWVPQWFLSIVHPLSHFSKEQQSLKICCKLLAPMIAYERPPPQTYFRPRWVIVVLKERAQQLKRPPFDKSTSLKESFWMDLLQFTSLKKGLMSATTKGNP